MLLYLLSRIVSTIAGSVYPAYASYKAINSGNSTRLTAWLMYWTVMGLFNLVEFVLDTFIFWFPFYYELKLCFILWMILPQTQGSIYLYQTVVDPYLAEHEHDIDRAIKDMQKQAMSMGIHYVKQAIQMLQNILFDFYNKTQNQGNVAAKDTNRSSTLNALADSNSATSSSRAAAAVDTNATPSNTAQGYFSWAISALSPAVTAVATMASERTVRHDRPMPVPPMNLYASQTVSSTSTGSSRREASSSSTETGFFGTSSLTETENVSSSSSSWSNRGTALRNRKISLYEDSESGSGSDTPPVPTLSAQGSESQTGSNSRSWINLGNFGNPPAYSITPPE